jgi:flagellar basal body rod protein FlgC
MRISTAVSTAASGLQAASAAVEVSAVNTANANDSQAQAYSASNSDEASGGVRVTISQAAKSGAGVDLTREAVAQSRAVATYQANVKALSADEERTDALMAIGRH